MIEIVKNKYNLKDSDITRSVTRVKALIINDKNQILLGHSYCEYQFPGGHIEEGEDLSNGLKRELLEETGLEYNATEDMIVARFTGYYKDTPEVGKNKKSTIYYFLIHDNRIPDLSNTSYTDEEIDGHFTLRYIPIDQFENIIRSNAEAVGDVAGIAGEMLELFSKINIK